MTEEAKKTRRDYMRNWQKSHPENMKRNSERYWERKAAKIREELYNAIAEEKRENA